MFKKTLLLISILLFSIKAFGVENTPSQVVKEFYTAYIKWYSPKFYEDVVLRKVQIEKDKQYNKHVSKDLKDILSVVASYYVYDLPTGLSDYNSESDYFLKVQDMESDGAALKTFKMEKETIKEIHAQILITFYIAQYAISKKDPVKNLVTLKKENGKWKIIKVRELNI